MRICVVGLFFIAPFCAKAQLDSVSAIYNRALLKGHYKTLNEAGYFPGNRIVLPKVLFDLNKATLRPESFDSLNKVAAFLIAHPQFYVEITNHSDTRFNPAYSSNLTMSRASACVDYLVSKGVPRERVKAKGYGKFKLLISDAEVAKLKTKEAQEAAHALNRRTEMEIREIKEPRIVKTMKDSVFAVWDIIVIPEILYSFDKADLLPRSKDSLNQVYDFLMKRTSLMVEMGVHTDARGSDAYNVKLSEIRASVCVDYLVKVKGLSVSRIKARGYGESQPIYNEEYIKRVKELEKQELYHQKNRRTELKVLKIE